MLLSTQAGPPERPIEAQLSSTCVSRFEHSVQLSRLTAGNVGLMSHD